MVLLAIAIASETTATLALLASVDSSWWLVVVVPGYVLAMLCLGLALRAGLGIGAAYGIWGASGVALTAVLGWVLFSEGLTLIAMVGIALIILGVVLVETGSPHPSPPPVPAAVDAAVDSELLGEVER